MKTFVHPDFDSTPIFKSTFHFDEATEVLTRVLDQPSRKLILDRNAELRKNPGAYKDLGAQSGESFGRLQAIVPMIMIEEAIKAGYALNSKDKAQREQAWALFLKSPAGQSCMVH